ncbi:MAG: helix-turn-helix domain-containing protein [Actinomycetia bacterium]|nr:helix-turn-helix domain-containing protein [Actinomycetes bacterium]
MQRRYEALRACHVEGLTSGEAAGRFGVSVHTVNAWRRDFGAGKMPAFFREQKRGQKKKPSTLEAKGEIIRLRKLNLSITEISERLKRKGAYLAPKTVAQILDAEGFARLPRRTAGERARYLAEASERQEPADVKGFGTEPLITTGYAGLFFFVPLIMELGLFEIFSSSKMYGSGRIPRENYLLSYLALKLLGGKRLSEATNLSFDRGLGLFAGLNVIPKASAVTSYSYRNPPSAISPMMRALSGNMYERGLIKGEMVNLDFHSIPFYGEESDHMEEHWITTRGKQMKSVLAFFAQDLETTYLFYSNGDIKVDEASDEVLSFVEFYRRSTGRLPAMLVFDSAVTTYENMAKLDRMGIRFLTLKRRGKRELEKIEKITEWKTYHLDKVKRIHKTPRVHERTINIKDLGAVREIVVAGTGREKPMLMITNDYQMNAKDAIIAYAHRWRIENSLAENVDFFNLNALASPVIVKVDFDMAMTLFANTLYKFLASKLRYYEHSRAKTLFRNFVEGRAEILVDDEAVKVKVEKRGRNPLLMDLVESYPDVRVPWWGNRRLFFEFV